MPNNRPVSAAVDIPRGSPIASTALSGSPALTPRSVHAAASLPANTPGGDTLTATVGAPRSSMQRVGLPCLPQRGARSWSAALPRQAEPKAPHAAPKVLTGSSGTSPVGATTALGVGNVAPTALPAMGCAVPCFAVPAPRPTSGASGLLQALAKGLHEARRAKAEAWAAAPLGVALDLNDRGYGLSAYLYVSNVEAALKQAYQSFASLADRCILLPRVVLALHGAGAVADLRRELRAAVASYLRDRRDLERIHEALGDLLFATGQALHHPETQRPSLPLADPIGCRLFELPSHDTPGLEAFRRRLLAYSELSARLIDLRLDPVADKLRAALHHLR